PAKKSSIQNAVRLRPPASTWHRPDRRNARGLYTRMDVDSPRRHDRARYRGLSRDEANRRRAVALGAGRTGWLARGGRRTHAARATRLRNRQGLELVAAG